MGKFACCCGNIIDLSPVPSYREADLFKACDDDALFDEAIANIEGFIEACVAGKQSEWVQRYYRDEAMELPTREVLYDILLNHFDTRALDVIQCEACHRLWIQAQDGGSNYLSWAPEGHGTSVTGTKPDTSDTKCIRGAD